MNEEKKNPSIQWYPGHMAKAKRNIEGDIALVDLVIQVVDARAPQSSQNPQIRDLAGKKPQVLVLNKRDMADANQTKEWLAIYRRQGFFACAVNAAQKQGIRELLGEIRKAAEPLMQSLEAKGRLRRPVRAMILGIPNCGKSTVINALSPQAVVKTANKPGVTKGLQWVKTAVGVELLDTPGVLWPKFATYQTALRLALIGSISDSVFPVYAVAEDLARWLYQKHPQALQTRYKLEKLPEQPEAIFEAIGRRRGLLASGNAVRVEDAAFLLLQEFRTGKLGAFTLDEPNEWGFSC